MNGRNTRRAWLLGAGVIMMLAVAGPAVGGAAGLGSGADRSASSITPSAQAMAEAVADPGSTQPIAGTELSVPVPDKEIGSVVKDLEIPLMETKGVVHGVAFYRPGPMEGSLIGGVSVVYDDTDVVRTADGQLADPDTIAKRVNPDLQAEVTTIGSRTVLAWADSDRVPSDWIPQEDRSVSRYVVVLDDGIAMVTFDDVPQKSAEAYLAVLAGAL